MRQGGSAPQRIADGIERMLAQATPTPTIEPRNQPGLGITKTDTRPSAPQTRQIAWVARRLVRAASTGMMKAASAATPLYVANPTPTQFAPSLYSADEASVVPYRRLVTAAVV